MSNLEPAATGLPDAAREVVLHFASDLGRLRELHGSPSFERMSSSIRHTGRTAGSKNTFHRMINGPDRIYGPEFVRGFVLALGLGDDEADAWEQRRIEALCQYQIIRDTAMTGQIPGCLPMNRLKFRGKRLAAAAIILVAAGLSSVAVVLTVKGNPASLFSGHLQVSPRDGADPKESGCSLDPAVRTLDSAEVDYLGVPVGLDELRYSPECGVAWTRFEPFPKAQIPSVAIVHVDVIRPGSDNLRMPFSESYAHAAVFGNVLRSTEDCVYAAVAIDVSGKGLPESHTHCFRGETPVADGGPGHGPP